MRILPFALTVPVLCSIALGQTTTPDVGSGAPSIEIQQAYLRAYFRSGFMNLVSLPPLGNVKTLGTTGLVQEFADAAKSQTNKYALIKANANAPASLPGGDVFQVYAGVYAFYTSSGLGPNNAGYPTMDTANCPSLVSSRNSCLYQLFDKPYALFVYKAPLSSGTADFATRDPFYTKWQSLGGIGSAGPANSAELAITTASGTAATVQTFDQGAVFNITSGTLSGRLVGVGSTVYAAYATAGGYSGILGLPVSDETLQPNGSKRQVFEGGFVEYAPDGPGVVHYAIQDIVISSGVSSLKLNLGDSMTLTATPHDVLGNALMDRPLTWATSNSRVIALQANGQTVTIKAIGGGSATVTASAEGKTSIPVSIVVSAPCCGLGEGAPTPAIQQAFLDAVARNHILLQLPAAGPVTRVGNGYVQTVQDATGAPYFIALADQTSTAYVVSGILLAKYIDLGGPSGPSGYPVSDATPGGRQMFENQTALAGNPVQLVAGNFLAKWAGLKFETGPAGLPTSAVSSVLSFQATTGAVQSFSGGVLVSVQSGPLAGKVFFVSGLVRAAYSQAGGPAGALGLPVNDEYVTGAKHQQDFEGGSVDYSPGDGSALVHRGDRHPLVTATPTQTLAGSRVHLALGGFDPGSTIKVSISGQPDFTVKTDTGAYIWDVVVATNAKSGTVTIHAADLAKPPFVADGSYTIRSQSEVIFQLKKLSGDGQNGIPGAVLLQPLQVLLKDDLGNPVPGLPVNFSASPGAQILAAATVTDANGRAEATLRLPPSDGIALATAAAGRQVTTFSAQAVHSSLLNFPRMTQLGDKGSMLAAVASILRYYQNRGDLPNANGFTDPSVLSQFLKSFCVGDSNGAKICDGFVSPPDSQDQLVNLWRLGSFVGGGLDVSIQKNDLATIRDLLGQGSPVLLAVSGSHFVVATGVGADGGILVMNPDPAFTPTVRDETLAAVVRLIPRAPTSSGFLITGNAAINLINTSGTCGAGAQLIPQFYMQFCDGAQDVYQLDVLGSQPFRLTITSLGTPAAKLDLSGPSATAYIVARTGTQWTVSPLTLEFITQGVVNAASFTPDLAVGGLFTIFGTGLAQANVSTAIEIAGRSAAVVAQSPFQVSGQVPLDLPAGTYSLKVASPYGTVEQPITVLPVAPALFRTTGQRGAILNQNGTLNTPDNPAPRGQAIVIFATGLGSVSHQGTLDVAQAPVTIVLQDAELKPFFAGLAPGFIGLYQINVNVPPATPPGLSLSLYLRQNDATSNHLEVAIQ